MLGQHQEFCWKLIRKLMEVENEDFEIYEHGCLSTSLQNKNNGLFIIDELCCMVDYIAHGMSWDDMVQQKHSLGF